MVGGAGSSPAAASASLAGMATVHHFIESCVATAELPAELAELLIEEPPWLDCKATVSMALAGELLGDAFHRVALGDAEISRFIEACNREVEALLYPSREVQEAAYLTCLNALAPFGAEYCSSNDPDYWVFDESLCSPVISVTTFRGFRFPAEAVAAISLEGSTVPDRYFVPRLHTTVMRPHRNAASRSHRRFDL